MKLRPSDAALLGTFQAGPFPHGIVFDGANLWVANQTTPGTVTKLRASDGVTLSTSMVGNNPSSLVFDGFSFWVTNTAIDSVTKLQ